MKDRLMQLMELEQLNPSKFADMIGVQRSSVSHVLSGRNNPSFDFIQKTLTAFTGLNAEWLILGKGKMYEHMGRGEPGTLFDTVQQELEEKKEKAGEEKKTEERNKEQNAHDARKERGEYGEKDEQEDISFGIEESEDSEEKRMAGKKENELTGKERSKRVVKVMVFYEDDTFKSFEPSL